MTSNWTQRIRQVKLGLILTALAIAGISLIVSHSLIRDLKHEELRKTEVWAEAMRSLMSADGNTDLSLVLKVLGGNHTIPVVVLDSAGGLLDHRNIRLNTSSATDSIATIIAMAQEMEREGRSIRMSLSTISPTSTEVSQASTDNEDFITVCYDESTMLKRLSAYPYVQLGVVALFIAVAIYAMLSSKRAEQRRIWVGLSRETAHQLGTPISSLMAWTEVLRETYPNDDLLPEMEQDVHRLQRIADRFSKIGSAPEFKMENLKEVVESAAGYMGRRTSDKVKVTCSFPSEKVMVKLCAPLMEWVIENLFKNAIDAMAGQGKIDINVYRAGNRWLIDMTDTGKGIAKRDRKNVFSPGFTTKKRGWGLGLSLAKRIVEEYHKGQIYVKRSQVGAGTTFTIELPTNNS